MSQTDRTTRSEAERRARALAPEIRRLLLEGYDAERRSLPWREESDPYRVWVSEVMLQQTRVETVLPYYKTWMERFPNLDALARAREEEVLRQWQGLGYYSRARHLWAGARLVREEFSGRLPDTVPDLLTLPGVGPYTAGALASIAFGQPVPAVDGNVRRVCSRLFDLPEPAPALLDHLAGELVDPNRPGDFNQALMELGATVCTPRSPGCGDCPLAEHCLALARDTVPERPRKKARRTLPEESLEALVAVRRDEHDRFFIRRRPRVGLLAGMWEFPSLSEEEGGASSLLQAMNLPAGPLHPLPDLFQAFTHLRILYRPVLLLVSCGGGPEEGTLPEEGRWVNSEEIRKLPLPVAQLKILGAAEDLLGP